MKMLGLVLVLAVAGCAVQPPQTQQPREIAVVDTTTPVCESPRQCEAMWLDAQDAVSMASRMRVRLATADRIETFAPHNGLAMLGVVTKYPIADGKYEIRLRLECYRGRDSCADMRPLGINLFNNMLAGYYPK